MMVNGIESINITPLTSQAVAERKSSVSFEKWFRDELAQTNELLNKSDVELQRLATGKAESIHEVMLSLKKASTAFELTVQVRNKLLDAYKEIMRMQV